ncbi:hypothetical protein TD95_000328 [Thielaviopsis punctulata]|uniref:Major facilitator superfamily (MFS) profile domain-containing protein n=1 Tax=Thielaviopsis punctulata TaxID=72032 RepID=A0A0F4Z7F7_9PEZI|nr:hypothetical protein TD95_000328 [Thielaviopsis punctulata]
MDFLNRGNDGRPRNRGFLGADLEHLSRQDKQDRDQLRMELDLNSWNLRIWGVAASGFLTDSYNLFSSNVILTSIAFVYWPHGGKSRSLIINVVTLFGSVIGQILFGYLADLYGRTRLYGIELLLVIISTIGVSTSSHGYDDLSFLALFCWWRFVMGIGIGAEYPLSAVITSEWSSTKSRGSMLSSVFMMQPVGQALAQLVGLWVLLGREDTYRLREMQCGLNTLHEHECKKIVDGIWRIVIGSGAIPALLAIIFRFFLFDSGLYTLEVKGKAGTALRNTQRVYGPGTAPAEGLVMNTAVAVGPGAASTVAGSVYAANMRGRLARMDEGQELPVQFSRKDLHKFFIEDKNWMYLLGTCATWFFLDVSFYGLSLDNRNTLADMWSTGPDVGISPSLSCWNSSLPGGNSTVPSWTVDGLPVWQTDPVQPCYTIYDVLLEQAKQYLLTVSLASIAGSACYVVLADKIPRRKWLTLSFFVLSVLFMVTGGVYYAVHRTPRAPATVALVAVCHFMFNFGANTLTFIIPAEIFPTCYRCTCHGISAAAGKIGSLVAIVVVYGINSSYQSSTRQGLIFILFGSVAALGALFSWAYLPDSQREVVDDEGSGKTRLESKTLEALGAGRAQAKRLGETVGVRGKLEELRRRRTPARAVVRPEP